MRTSGGACQVGSQRSAQSAALSPCNRRKLILYTVASVSAVAVVDTADDANAAQCEVPSTLAAPARAPALAPGSIQAKLDCNIPGSKINLPGNRITIFCYVCASDGTTG